MIIRVHNEIDKDYNSWSNRDFLLYYASRYKRCTGRDFEIPAPAWRAYMGKIKGFRDKLSLSGARYKQFLDDVFKYFYDLDGYVPMFGAVVNERVFHLIRRYRESNNLTTVDVRFIVSISEKIDAEVSSYV